MPSVNDLIRMALQASNLAVRQLEEQAPLLSVESLRAKVKKLVDELIPILGRAREAGWSVAGIQAETGDWWRIYGESSFVQFVRSNLPGHWKAIEKIVGRLEDAPENTLAGALGWHALDSLIAEQHRSKLQEQAEAMRECCLAKQVKGLRPVIVSIGCGSSLDAKMIRRVLIDSGALLFLLDFDEQALRSSAQNLEGVNLKTVQINVRDLDKLFSVLEKLNGQSPLKIDLFLAGGLFDYLRLSMIKKMMKGLMTERLMAPGGQIFFTNIAKGNPFAAWMEVFGKWGLIERTEDEMRVLLAETGVPEKNTELRKDRMTKLAWIAKATV